MALDLMRVDEMLIAEVEAALENFVSATTTSDFYGQPMHDFLATEAACFGIDASQRNASDYLSSPETPMAEKLANARAYMFTSLVSAITIANRFGVREGKFMLPFPYSLDTESTKPMVREFVDWLSKWGVAIDIRGSTRNGGFGTDCFTISWHHATRELGETT